MNIVISQVEKEHPDLDTTFLEPEDSGEAEQLGEAVFGKASSLVPEGEPWPSNEQVDVSSSMASAILTVVLAASKGPPASSFATTSDPAAPGGEKTKKP